MPTRRSASYLCTGTILIVEEGVRDEHVLEVIITEVMNTASGQWLTAIDLPELMYLICILMIKFIWLGRCNKYYMKNMKSVYTSSLSAILQTCHSRSLGECIARSLVFSLTKPGTVWRRICNVSVRYSSYVSLRGQLLAVGGLDVHTKTTSPVYVYDPSINSREIISHMAAP